MMVNFSNITVKEEAETVVPAPQADPAKVAERNGFIQGYNDGFTEAAQSVNSLIVYVFIGFVLQLVAHFCMARDVPVPVIQRYVSGGRQRVWRFVDQASWSASFFLTTLLTYSVFFPFALT